MRKITAEEIEIKVTADVIGVLREFKKMLPEIRKQKQQIQKELDNTDFTAKIQNIDAKQVIKQVKEVSKQINNAFDPNSTKGMKYSGIKDEIRGISKEFKNLKVVASSVDFGSLKYQKDLKNMPHPKVSNTTNKQEYAPYLTAEERLKKNASVSKTEEVSPSTQSLSLWDVLKSKINQVKPIIKDIKADWQSTDGILGKLRQNIQSVSQKLKPVVKLIKQIVTAPIKGIANKFSNIGKSVGNVQKGLKSSLWQILKYAGALFSLRGIYSVLRNASQAWLSSENAQAKQASANISYLSYAWGSVFAPIVQFVTNLIYKLTKAIQSLVYAFSGINIFAKATASSMKKTAGSAKETNKSLSGVHNEINNVSDTNNGGGSGEIEPSMDLTSVNPASSFMEAIKNGEWSQAGQLIAQKINEAMSKIDWTSIQNKVKEIATNIGLFINGFVARLDWILLGYTIGQGITTALIFVNTLLNTTNFVGIGTAIATGLNSVINSIDWEILGNTIASGFNMIIDTLFGFVTRFDWKKLGLSIATSINTLFNDISWSELGQTFSTGIKGIFDTASIALEEIDWKAIGEDVATFLSNIDWKGILSSVGKTITEALGAGIDIASGLFGTDSNVVIATLTAIATAFGILTSAIGLYKIGLIAMNAEQIKSNLQMVANTIALGAKTVATGLCTAATWLFNTALTVLTSPITLVIIAITALIAIIVLCIKHWNTIKEAVINVCTILKDKIVEKFTEIKENVSKKVSEIKDKIVEKFTNTKNDAIKIWENIKSGISEKITNLKTNLHNTLNNISNAWSNIWTRNEKYCFKYVESEYGIL